MTQPISYAVRFSFPSDHSARERILPAVDLYLRALEDADRLAAGVLGLDLDYHRALREMGVSEFRYSVSAAPCLPPQPLLGSRHEGERLRNWITRVRADICAAGAAAAAGAGESDGAGETAVRRWDAWAAQEGLADSLAYSPPGAADAAAVINDTARALGELGGPSAVTLILRQGPESSAV